MLGHNFNTCIYCGNNLDKVLGHDLLKLNRNFKFFERGSYYYVCQNGHELAYVRAHTTSGLPMGFVANRHLRGLRIEAHKAFDTLWKGRTAHMSRKDAYYWLAEAMKIPVDNLHMSWLTAKQCQAVVDAISDYWFNKETL